ncbi:androgen-induced gene 1 protein-like [Hydractinia symbiolongicarpus]|uniref:androgen-induced gene 1 protein-like n=1 Tax=Hydractinia symbiolongicarpus TaxID=13093 RepID=UPI00254B7CB5|nr:androgen-induced gene 1 protein-like [Hydractinia symbiolongicarpus]XP_057289808.1 androgen-induced gene 1 protein-like [Hydractinia symbiolongicarpus]
MFAKPGKCAPSVTKTSCILHSSLFIWYCFGIYHDRCCYPFSENKTYGGRTKYLTHITAYLVWISSGVACFADLIQLTTNWLESKSSKEESRSVILLVRDELMSFWAFTLSVFVCILYWGILYVDYDGMHSEAMEKISPLFGWFNQFLHTLPIIIAFILTICVNYQHPPIWRILIYIVTLGSGYLSWINHCAKMNGYYAYPFMNHQSSSEFIIFCIFCHFVFFFIYLIGRKFASYVWSAERSKNYNSSKKN